VAVPCEHGNDNERFCSIKDVEFLDLMSNSKEGLSLMQRS
jgi:hypothetical protein